MHGGMVMVSGEEMHKSLGNFWPVTAALERYEPEVIRFFLTNVQYRGPIDFTPDLLDEAKRSYGAWRRRFAPWMQSDGERPRKGKRIPNSERNEEGPCRLRRRDVRRLQHAGSIAVLFEYARALNKAIEMGAGRAELDSAARPFERSATS